MSEGSTPPWRMRSSTRRPTGFSAMAARGVDAAFAGIEAEHYFAEADTVPAAVFRFANVEVGHGSPNVASESTIKNEGELGKYK
jgi:hypothetical protein